MNLKQRRATRCAAIAPSTLMLFVTALLFSGCELIGDAQRKDAPTSTPPSTANVALRTDPQMQAVLDKLVALGPKPIETLTPVEARRQPTIADAVKALMQERGMDTTPEPVGKVEDRQIAGAAGRIPARVYWPQGTGPFPLLLYIHGGGWVIATIDTYDASARALTNAANAIVVSIEYRKGPEHKFPAAHEDAFAAYKWMLANATVLNGDAARVAVAGESAGGNMAANVVLLARDRKAPLPLYQVLVYPVANNDLNAPSMIEQANAVPLKRAMLPWFLGNYLNNGTESNDPRIALVKADLKGLPPATVITAELDPLRSEGRLLAEKLRSAGVRVDYHNYEGVAHEFFGTGAIVDKAKQAVAQAAGGLKQAFASSAAIASKTR